MSTAAGTVLISKETSYSSIYTYYKAVLGSSPIVTNNQLNFNITLTITMGASSGLGTGEKNNRTAYVYDGNGNLIGSQLIKNNSSWSAGQTYTYTVPCSISVGNNPSGTLADCYIRILYSEAQDYGSVASAYWNGKTNKSGGSVGNTFSIQYSAGIFVLTLIKGANIASVSGGGNIEAGTTVTVTCTLDSDTGYTYTFDKWESSNTALLPDGTSQSYTFVMPSGNITLTAQAIQSGDSITITFDANGGAVSPSTKIVNYGMPYGALPTPVWSGHNFTGWQASNGKLITSKSIVEIFGAHTLTAQWSEGGGRLFIDGTWRNATPYIYTAGSWRKPTPYIYKDGTWKVGN